MKNSFFFLFLIFSFSCVKENETSLSKKIIQDQNRFLMLDDRNIQKTSNAKLVLGEVKKHPQNPLFGEDKPWEKRFDNLYGNVIYDKENKLYKCWYSPFIVDHSAKGMTLAEREKPYKEPPNREMGICYAVSKDGITWIKPELGLIEFEGKNNNNLIWRGPHGAGIFKDPIDTDSTRRYKTIFQGLSFSTSSDGINWAKDQKVKGVDVAGDTHNNAFWAPTLGKYVGITRSWRQEEGKNWRQVARIESEDFLNWTKEEVVLEGEGKNDQTYAMPVFYYGGVYLGLLAIYSADSDRTWTELAWSPDTKQWNRISPGTALIPTSDKVLDYDYGCVYACATPIFLKDEIRFYYGGSDYLHFGWRNGSLCLATLRPDGFAGFKQKNPKQPTTIITKSINYSGQPIQISADVETGGYIKASIINKSGDILASAKTIKDDITDGRLHFDQPLNNGQITLKFESDQAIIYSFSFGKNYGKKFRE